MRMPVVVLFAIGVIVACSSPTSVCGCSPYPTISVLVVGTVRAANDSPLGGALIRVRGTPGSCLGSRQATAAGDTSSITSDSAGRYRLLLTRSNATFVNSCVQLTARRSALATAATLASVAVSVTLRRDPPFDSTRIDFPFP